MLNTFLNNTITELKTGMVKRGHPFKYVTLTTVDELMPVSRTVVLRSWDEQTMEGVIFTDGRSAKVAQLKKNDNACILAYHPKKMLQVKMQGTLRIINSEKRVAALFHKINPKALKDYTTTDGPGSAIENPDKVEYLNRSQAHFTPLLFTTTSIEVLQLKKPNHLRALFTRDKEWKGQWLVP